MSSKQIGPARIATDNHYHKENQPDELSCQKRQEALENFRASAIERINAMTIDDMCVMGMQEAQGEGQMFVYTPTPGDAVNIMVSLLDFMVPGIASVIAAMINGKPAIVLAKD